MRLMSDDVWVIAGLFEGVALEKINLTLSEEKYQCAYTGNHYKAPYMVSSYFPFTHNHVAHAEPLNDIHSSKYERLGLC